MANTLRFKRGLVSGIPNGALGEPLFTTDTFDLYIGNGTGNTRFQKYIASGTTSQLLRGDGSLLTMPIVLTSPANGEVLKYNGTNWVNSSDDGVTGSGIARQVTFWNSAGTITGSNNLFWDNTNGRLAIARTNTQPIPTKLYVAGATGSAIAVSSDFAPGSTASPINLDYTFLGFANTEIARIRSSDVSSNFNAGILSFWTRESGTLAERARFTFGGNFLLNSTTDNGLRFQVTGDGYFSGSVGIGSSSLTGSNLRISKTLTGSASAINVYLDSTIQSDVTNSPKFFATTLNTQAAAFSIGRAAHYVATQGTIGAGSSIAIQVGFEVTNSLTGGAFNYGFFSDIAAASQRWNLYCNGTANNYMAGSLGIGTTTLTGFNLRIGKNIEGAATSYGAAVVSNVQSTVTNGRIFYSEVGTQAAAFTLNELNHYFAVQGVFGAGSTVTNQFGFRVLNNLTGATNNYGFYGDIASGTGRWNLYMNGTANNYLNGNLGLGVLPSAWRTTEKAIQIGAYTALTDVFGYSSIGNNYFVNASNQFIYLNTAAASVYSQNAGNHVWQSVASGTAGASFTFATRMTLFPTGNLLVGTGSDAGFRLDVNGTMRVSGASSFGGTALGSAIITARGHISIAGGQRLYLWNTANSTAPYISNSSNDITFYTNTDVNALSIASTGAATFSSSVTATNLTLTDAGGGIINNNTGNLFFQKPTSGGFIFRNGSPSFTEYMRLDSTGNLGIGMTPSYKLDVTGEARVSNAISIGTTPDTNKPFKILKNINGTVGINFENTSTGSLAFSAIQMGTDVSGGTKFTNIVYSSSGVAQSGVYYPDGTSIINIGTGGLNFYSQGAPIRMFNGGGNGVLKWEMVNDSFINHYTGTAPTTSATDGYRQYSADVTAGNAAPHFRTENGAVIKLYQETTGVGNAIFSQGGGNSVLDDSTFDGYTLRQIVKALRNQGILA